MTRPIPGTGKRGSASNAALGVVLAGVLTAVLAAAGAAAHASLHATSRPAAAGLPCRLPAPSALAARRTLAALASPLDLWGKKMLAAPGGPSLALARADLPPLFEARAAKQSSLTESGSYYLPFAEPVGRLGAGAVALHLADGSQIVSARIGGPSLTIGVGAAGAERFGSCLARLSTPSLGDGYLPILETRYRDSEGASYRQESFAASPSGLPGLTSFVRMQVDARGARGPVELRFALSTPVLRASAGRLLAGGDTELLFSPGGRLEGSSLLYRLSHGRVLSIEVAFLDRPGHTRRLPGLAELYASARHTEVGYWQRRLAAGASVTAPDAPLDDAEKALLIQNLELGYRYSVGNSYQEFSFPETVDVARVMGEWGYGALDRAILRLSFSRRPTPYPNWSRGEKLVGTAEYDALFHDRAFVEQVTPTLARYVSIFARELLPSGLLPREQYSSDIPLQVYGLPSQTVVWEGLVAMARAWADSGHEVLAARSDALAARLHAGIERALSASQRWLPDGSLFAPVMLLAHEHPYRSLTRSRLGTYWNLDMPYALASGFFAPGSPAAAGVLDYLRRHGALLLGLVRAGAYSLYGRHARPPISGTDEVYGLNLARFLADNEQAGELVLSLYGQLADAMTPGTFSAGEAASVAPLPDAGLRAMYLPPNSAANATFLETLRLTVVHERDDRAGRPEGLELGYATPRSWLLPGRRIQVSRLPTSFGPLSFSISAAAASIRIVVAVPPRRPGSLRLRLRLPGRERIAAVTSAGRPYRHYVRATGTIDLSGLHGSVRLSVALDRAHP